MRKFQKVFELTHENRNRILGCCLGSVTGKMSGT